MDPDGIVMDIDLGPGANGLVLTNLAGARFAGRDGEGPLPDIASLGKDAVPDADTLAHTPHVSMRDAPGAPCATIATHTVPPRGSLPAARARCACPSTPGPSTVTG